MGAGAEQVCFEVGFEHVQLGMHLRCCLQPEKLDAGLLAALESDQGLEHQAIACR